MINVSLKNVCISLFIICQLLPICWFWFAVISFPLKLQLQIANDVIVLINLYMFLTFNGNTTQCWLKYSSIYKYTNVNDDEWKETWDKDAAIFIFSYSNDIHFLFFFFFWGQILDWSKSRHWYYWECVSMQTMNVTFDSLWHMLYCPSHALSLRRKAWAESVLTGWVNNLIVSLHIIIISDRFYQTTKNRLIGLGTITNMTLI